MNPLVSIVVPVRDGERWLADALESVLAQSYEPIETIVVDDGSADASAEIARRLGAKVLKQPGLGLGVALNNGVQATTGAYVGFLDADDLFPPRRVDSMMSVLLARPDVDGVYGLMEEFEDETHSGRDARPPALSRLRQCLLFRRAVVERVGAFNQELAVAETIEWVARAVAEGVVFITIDEVVLRRRLHDSNMGLTRWDERGDYAKALHSGLQARRRSRHESDL